MIWKVFFLYLFLFSAFLVPNLFAADLQAILVAIRWRSSIARRSAIFKSLRCRFAAIRASKT